MGRRGRRHNWKKSVEVRRLKPTAEQKQVVALMASQGFPKQEIANAIKVNIRSLEKHFGVYLKGDLRLQQLIAVIDSLNRMSQEVADPENKYALKSAWKLIDMFGHNVYPDTIDTKSKECRTCRENRLRNEDWYLKHAMWVTEIQKVMEKNPEVKNAGEAIDKINAMDKAYKALPVKIQKKMDEEWYVEKIMKASHKKMVQEENIEYAEAHIQSLEQQLLEAKAEKMRFEDLLADATAECEEWENALLGTHNVLLTDDEKEAMLFDETTIGGVKYDGISYRIRNTPDEFAIDEPS